LDVELKAKEEGFETIKNLFHFETPEKGKSLADKIAEGMILNSLYFSDDYISLSDIKVNIKTLFDIHYEDHEIKNAIKRLAKDNQDLEIKDSNGEKRYSLSDKCRNILQKKIEENTKLEYDIYNAWKAEINKRYINLSQEELDTLIDRLQFFNKQLLLKHGALCSKFICPQKFEDSQNTLELPLSSLIPTMPLKLIEVAKKEFILFWRTDDTNRIRYLARLLDNVFIIRTASIDSKCSELVKGTFDHSKLYLDTNAIYRILNFEGPEYYYPMIRLKEMANRLGVKLFIAGKTLRELQISLIKNEQYLKRYPISSPELAEIALQSTSESDFITAYLNVFSKHNISLDDFFAQIRNIEELIKKESILIDEDDHLEVHKLYDYNKQKALLLSSAGRKASSLCEDVIAHDIFLTHLVKNLRRKHPSSFAKAKIWLLTCDNKLIKYDALIRKEDHALVPLCILPDRWVQLVRWALPRTDDFDKAFIDLVTSPFISTIANLPSETALKICSRIDMYRKEAQLGIETAKKLALIVTVDRILKSQCESLPEKEQIEAIDKSIKSALEKLAKDAKEREERYKAVEKVALDRESALELTSIQAAKLQDKLDEEQKRKEIAEIKVAQKDEELRKEKEERLKAESKAKRSQEKYEKIVSLLKWGGCVVIWLTLGIVSLRFWYNIPKLLQFALVFSIIWPLSLPLGFKKTWKVFIGISAILGVVRTLAWLLNFG
jgi:hypothetical protein